MYNNKCHYKKVCRMQDMRSAASCSRTNLPVKEVSVSFAGSALPTGKHFACFFLHASHAYLAEEKIRAHKLPTVSPRKWRSYTEIQEGEAVCGLKADERIRGRRIDKGGG